MFSLFLFRKNEFLKQKQRNNTKHPQSYKITHSYFIWESGPHPFHMGPSLPMQKFGASATYFTAYVSSLLGLLKSKSLKIVALKWDGEGSNFTTIAVGPSARLTMYQTRC